MNRPLFIFIVGFVFVTGNAAFGQTDFAKKLAEWMPGISDENIEKRSGPQNEWHKICLQAGAPEKDAERKAICSAMLGALKSSDNQVARLFLVRQFEKIGREECVDEIAEIMMSGRGDLRDAARRALTNNPTAKAGDALRAGAPPPAGLAGPARAAAPPGAGGRGAG